MSVTVRIHGALVAMLVAAPTIGSAQTSSNPPPTFKTEVIASTPLPGLDLTMDQIPAPVQTAVSADIENSGAVDLSDFLNRRFTSVFVNEVQGNPFQADINYRGYTASPLLGTPQGLSVYMDGVRLNQPFGDVVSWDLIPRVAIGATTLIPGSNPLFGLNTLGGALALETKDGRTSPGTSVRATYGSGVRRAVELEHGGSRAGGLHWYVAANLFADDGWRVASPSTVRQVFAKVGRHAATHDVALEAGYADNDLTGNGLQEQRLLAQDYASVYTIPDETRNRATFINLTARRDRSTRTLSGNVYYRDIRANTLNGDLNDGSLDQSVYQPNAAEQRALAAAGYRGFPTSGATAANTPFPSWRCIANVLLNDEPGETCDGLLNRTTSVQHNYGASGQATWRDWLARRNTLVLGAAYDGSRSTFQQSTQLGYLNPDRSVTPLNAFADGGLTGGSVDGVPYDTRVDLRGRVNTGSVFASDVLPMGSAWTLTVAGRYNRTAIANLDRLVAAAGPGSLTGDHAYGRLNPAAGVTFTASRSVNLYAGYSEGSRAPTSIELGCADPANPCKLPNAMAGDPPLDQVVTRTVEAGVRGLGAIVNWRAGVFRAANAHDILFVASTQTGFGYFTNVGSTRRQGVELGLDGRKGRASGGLGYTLLDATFQSSETVDGTGNSTNDSAQAGAKGLDGTIAIRPGDRLPLVPRHTFKAFGDLQATSRLSIDLDVIAASGVVARGNENNLHQPDGTYYLGPGTTPEYAIVNLGARYRITKQVEVLGQVNNLFDHRYYTAAQLGSAGITPAGTYLASPLPAIDGRFPVPQSTFYAPGAPAMFWVALHVRM